MVLFITCFKLDTRCTYDCIGTSGKNCQNPHEGILVNKQIIFNVHFKQEELNLLLDGESSRLVIGSDTDEWITICKYWLNT